MPNNLSLGLGLGSVAYNSWIMSGASLDFDFFNGLYYQAGQNGNINSLLATARASTGYAENLAGVWSSFLSNVPRITNKGLLVEEARTNSVRNNSMQGAVAGSPGTLPTNWTSLTSTGGLTQTVVGVGIENGIDYIDIRWNGTTSNTTATDRGFEANTQIAAVVGQTWSQSAFVSLIGGSLANISGFAFRTRERDAGGTSLLINTFGFTPIAGSLGLNRFVSPVVLSQATTAFVVPEIAFTVSGTGVAVDFTLRIGWPQLELGAFATSPIRTTGAAATRAADAVTVTTPPVFGSAYSMFARATPKAPINHTSTQFLMAINAGSSANRLSLTRAATTGNAAGINTSASAVTNLNFGGPWGQDTSGRSAIATANLDQAGKFSAGVLFTAGGALPIGVNLIHIGNPGSVSNLWNGYIERIAIWPNTRLSNSDLQRITA